MGMGLLFMWGYLPAQSLIQPVGQASRLPAAVNSSLEESTPVLEPISNKLYFTRGNHPENIGGSDDAGDIWYAPPKENGWGIAVHMPRLNNTHTHQLIGFADGGKALYFIHKTEVLDEEEGTIRILRSLRGTQGWRKPQAVHIPHLRSKSIHLSGYVSPDERVIIFATEGFGSYGNEDLYVSTKDAQGHWLPPKNLGNTLNTAYQERSPFLMPDTRTLVFASNTKNGYGSWDLYQSQRLDDSWVKWSTPQNLGPKINTAGIESYFFADVKKSDTTYYAYFMRAQNSNGYGDLWRIRIQPPPHASPITFTTQRLQAYDKITAKKLSNSPTLRLLSPTISMDTSLQLSPASTATLRLQAHTTHTLTCIIKGYLPLVQAIEVPQNNPSPIALLFTPIHAGDVLIEDIFFIKSTARFTLDSAPSLDKMCTFLKENPTITLFISGHTDNQGDFAKNLRLSKARVQAVISYMVRKGIEKYRLSGEGYGSAKPAASNLNERGRKQNRRVEFTIHLP